jgi:glycosyltransferase involved in cell wall biosynthesis
MERLRNPYSGLGQYCLQLGQAFVAEGAATGMEFTALVPEHRLEVFGASMRYKVVKPWHRWFGIQLESNVWHCMHQDSDYLPRNKKIAVAYTIHDLNFLERPDYTESKKKRKLATMQQRINRAAGLVYISEFVRTQVHIHLSVPEGIKEQVIYNGGGHPEEMSDTQQVVVKRDKPFLFSIGIHPKKNYHVLMPLLAAQEAYDWVIAGPDSREYQATIREEAAKWGIEQRVHFIGPISEAEKWAYYQECEALLFPSLSEGFGLPVVEAMALGKPVFLSTRCSLPEIGGEEAFYFPDFEAPTLMTVFENGMNAYRNDPKKPTRLKNRAAQFSWKAAATHYLDFYKTLSGR